jgi:hypothetical protein
MTAIPDIPGVVAGWRAWRIGRSAAGDPELMAALRGTKWPAGRKTVATCHNPDHDPPEAGCGCGLYGAVVADHVMGLDDSGVLGSVALWGEVVEGTRGWRASNGYPRVLVTGPEVDEQTRARLEVVYRVPAHRSRHSLSTLARAISGPPQDQAYGLLAGVDMTDSELRLLTQLESQERVHRERLAREEAALGQWLLVREDAARRKRLAPLDAAHLERCARQDAAIRERFAAQTEATRQKRLAQAEAARREQLAQAEAAHRLRVHAAMLSFLKLAVIPAVLAAGFGWWWNEAASMTHRVQVLLAAVCLIASIALAMACVEVTKQDP